MQKWIVFQFCHEESCAFLLKYLGIHLRFEHTCVGSKLLEEVFELLMSNDRGCELPVHTYS